MQGIDYESTAPSNGTANNVMGAPVDEVVAEVLQLAQAREIDAITGWHISSIRKKLEPLLNGKIPLKVACEGLHS